MTDTVTIQGNVANDPTRHTTSRGDTVINFRLASAQRWFDSRTGTWNDGATNWYDVSAFRQLAENAKSSLHVGDPVIVTGRLKVRRWESNGKSGTAVEIEAEAIGHNMRLGASAFAKPHRPQAATQPEQPAPPQPTDDGSESGFVDAATAWNVPAGANDEPGANDESGANDEEAQAEYAELQTV